MSTWKIVADSSSDLALGMPCAEGVSFALAPLKINVGEQTFVDDAALDVREMMQAMESFDGPSGTACPSPEDFAKEFRSADYSFAITITSALSGTYNSALVARDMVLEEFPEKKICVLDSRATAGPLSMTARKINALIAEGLSFEEVRQKAEEYLSGLQLLFTLSSFDNLVKNGRMNRLLGLLATKMNIRAIGRATEKGELGILHKVRGEAHTFGKMVEEMPRWKEMADCEEVVISHCFNETGARLVKKLIEKSYPGIPVQIEATRGLNSFYTERSGILIAY